MLSLSIRPNQRESGKKTKERQRTEEEGTGEEMKKNMIKIIVH